ncbi:class I SAM-dependent methyltransferase [Pseudidiomarina mangrovi]|uniref:class I SAM-dependent methyltransferase n=1 Tax=Pseudidiomarina mangrovi TaxID=2487133 RepID=UPI000FCB4ACF|nr:class I SAM-dependent methyltransferase [Pseudidiomarina mangrovi]
MEHWSAYWQTSGVLNSFAEGNVKDGYSGELKQFWEHQFASAPATAKIIDIGTGNGALAILAYDYGRANQRHFSVEGLDKAVINPAKQFEQQPTIAKKLKAITFHSAVAAEELPFADQSVDLAVSQFGFEYSDRKESMRALAKALKPGAKAIFVSHHSNSELTKNSQHAVEVLRYCLEVSPLFQQADMYFDLARQAIPQIGLEGWQTFPHHTILSRSLKWTMDILQERFSAAGQKAYVNDVISRVARLLQAMTATNQPQLMEALGLEYRLLNDHRMRVEDQLNASLAKKDISTLVKSAKQLDMTLTAEELAIDGKLFGWVLVLTKSA